MHRRRLTLYLRLFSSAVILKFNAETNLGGALIHPLQFYLFSEKFGSFEYQCMSVNQFAE